VLAAAVIIVVVDLLIAAMHASMAHLIARLRRPASRLMPVCLIYFRAFTRGTTAAFRNPERNRSLYL